MPTIYIITPEKYICIEALRSEGSEGVTGGLDGYTGQPTEPMSHKLYVVVEKAQVHFDRTCRESPCGPILGICSICTCGPMTGFCAESCMGPMLLINDAVDRREWAQRFC